MWRRAVLVALALVAVAVWMSAAGDGSSDATRERGVDANERPIGTSGRLTTIRDLETITGVNNGYALVGRRAELHVPVQRYINDGAFWVGPSDNRLLVVVARDTRFPALADAPEALVTGTIHAVPAGDAVRSWGLTSADAAELSERPIYLRADGVRPYAGAAAP